jgi:pentatricopeptide repeat protein
VIPRRAQATSIVARMGCGGAPRADAACFNAAITACDRGGQWAKAAALLGDMRRLGVRPAPRPLPRPRGVCLSAEGPAAFEPRGRQMQGQGGSQGRERRG